MKELGFIIDRTGKLSKFGEIAKDLQHKERKNIHDYSFHDEIEDTEYFINLNLVYNKDMGLYGKFITFALQGIISGIQDSDGSKKKLVMYVPKVISEEQKETLLPLCDELKGYQSYNLAVYSDLQNYIKYDSFDKLFENLVIINDKNKGVK